MIPLTLSKTCRTGAFITPAHAPATPISERDSWLLSSAPLRLKRIANKPRVSRLLLSNTPALAHISADWDMHEAREAQYLVVGKHMNMCWVS